MKIEKDYNSHSVLVSGVPPTSTPHKPVIDSEEVYTDVYREKLQW